MPAHFATRVSGRLYSRAFPSSWEIGLMNILLPVTVLTVFQPLMFMAINMGCLWRVNVSKCQTWIVLPATIHMLMKQTGRRYFLKDVLPVMPKLNIHPSCYPMKRV